MKKPTTRAVSRPSYGIDAPSMVRALVLIGVGAIVAGALIKPFDLGRVELTLIGPTLMSLGSVSLLRASSMLLYSRVGKFRVREAMLDMVKWRGDEAVLDVGTGLGLLAVGAARRLRGGTVTGIDIWSADDLSGNSFDNAQRNIEEEGVEGRVQLRTENASEIGFVDGSFDVVLSLLCLHGLRAAEERRAACREIARVLKPGGAAIIADYANIGEYARELEAAGLIVRKPRSLWRKALTPVWVVQAHKRARADA